MSLDVTRHCTRTLFYGVSVNKQSYSISQGPKCDGVFVTAAYVTYFKNGSKTSSLGKKQCLGCGQSLSAGACVCHFIGVGKILRKGTSWQLISDINLGRN